MYGSEIKKALRRLAIGIGLLTLASGLFYYVDETSFAHREVDGYIPSLLFMRLALGIWVAGMLFAIVYPVRMILTRAPLAYREMRGGQPSSQPNEFLASVEKMISSVLYLLVAIGTYFLLRTPLDRALLPLGGLSWVPDIFLAAFLGAGVFFGLMAVARARSLVAPMRTRAASRSAARAASVPKADKKISAKAGKKGAISKPQAGTTTIFCPSCGATNAADGVFCESCGERLGV